MAGLSRIDDDYIRGMFSQNLKRILGDKKISQKSFSEMMGVSESHVSRWMSGVNSPSWKTFADICAKLDVKPRCFFETEDFNAQSFHNQIEEAHRLLRSIEKKVSGL